MSKIYCYKRASTDKQDFFRQDKILNDKGYFDGKNCIFVEEHFTGTTKDRPILNKLLNHVLEPGDTIVATELSRISRSVKDFNNLLDEILKKKKVNIIILKENFNLLANGNMDAMTKLILNITSAFAEFERDIISDRTKDALAYKKIYGTKSGKPTGRPRGENSSDDCLIKALEFMIEKNVGQRKTAFYLNYPVSTLNHDIQQLYKKYNTKDYKIILEKLKKDIS